MILFVFEGAEREPRIFKTLERLFFGKEERLVCSFGNNIYELYRQLREFDGEGISSLFFGRTMRNCRQALNRQISLKSIFSLTTISRIPI